MHQHLNRQEVRNKLIFYIKFATKKWKKKTFVLGTKIKREKFYMKIIRILCRNSLQPFSFSFAMIQSTKWLQSKLTII